MVVSNQSAKKIMTAIIGSGNIGTDLMIKIAKSSDLLDVGCVIGIDPNSEGLAMARERGFATSPLLRSCCQYGRPFGRAKCQYGDMWWTSHDSHGRRCVARLR